MRISCLHDPVLLARFRDFNCVDLIDCSRDRIDKFSSFPRCKHADFNEIAVAEETELYVMFVSD